MDTPLESVNTKISIHANQSPYVYRLCISHSPNRQRSTSGHAPKSVNTRNFAATERRDGSMASIQRASVREQKGGMRHRCCEIKVRSVCEAGLVRGWSLKYPSFTFDQQFRSSRSPQSFRCPPMVNRQRFRHRYPDPTAGVQMTSPCHAAAPRLNHLL